MPDVARGSTSNMYGIMTQILLQSNL